MQYVRPDIATLCVGQASSAAAVLLAAGTPGKRSMLKHAKVVLHQPSTEEGWFDVAQGALPDLAVKAKDVARLRAEMDEILSLHTGHPVEKIRSDIDRHRTFSAAEAVAYGLADEIITSVKLGGGRELQAARA
jgi:ATP-dependent Clp protease protease subunit